MRRGVFSFFTHVIVVCISQYFNTDVSDTLLVDYAIAWCFRSLTGGLHSKYVLTQLLISVIIYNVVLVDSAYISYF
jgi:hypothetical protein